MLESCWVLGGTAYNNSTEGHFLRAPLTYTRLMERHSKTQAVLEMQLQTQPTDTAVQIISYSLAFFLSCSFVL